jgi:putative methanogenesis marker protein 8
MSSLDEVVGEHEFYCCGARVLLKRGEIKILSEPMVVYCPLLESMYGVREVNIDIVRRIVEKKIQDFGFCCKHRLFDSSMVVPYGSSEIISVCMDLKLIDCGVVVCDGVGTVVTSNPKLIQGIGARLTGIIRTSPIDDIIDYVKSMGGIAIDESTAKIDQVEGIVKAIELGYKRIAVTIAGFESASIEAIRSIESKMGVEIAIFSVCNTCASSDDAMRISSGADIVCASASRIIREIVGSRAIMQLGVAIPVYALTKLGKKLLLSYLTEFEGKIVAFRVQSLPYLVEGRGPITRG